MTFSVLRRQFRPKSADLSDHKVFYSSSHHWFLELSRAFYTRDFRKMFELNVANEKVD